MSRFYMLIGLPGSGKSTWSLSIANYNTSIISSDTIREELYGDVNDTIHNDETFNFMFSRTVKSLNSGRDVIYDATNLSRKRRINLLKQLPLGTEKCAVLFAVPFTVCMERNLSRDRIVPENVMNRMYKSFNVPSTSEGFDYIHIVSPGVDEIASHDELLFKLYDGCDLPHDNPHHTYTCGQHCISAANNAFNIARRERLSSHKMNVLVESALYHDAGKPFCKVWHNAKGEESDVAHFYNHENVSAYDYICGKFAGCSDAEMERILLVANLINNHMVFFAGDKAIEKRRKQYGEDFWKILTWLHEADMSAH